MTTSKESEERFEEISSYGVDHIICVIEDDRSEKIIATGSVFIEKKFVRDCGKVGHIEDVVVDSTARGKQLGKKIIAFLTGHAQSMGCYKLNYLRRQQGRRQQQRRGRQQRQLEHSSKVNRSSDGVDGSNDDVNGSSNRVNDGVKKRVGGGDFERVKLM
ncbi:glucosamine 6-phosphate N-acetyltransferase-like [Ricinus communis]|uniref:glucosamine 6-phosphate N-acetyltransferase-like n=1 Tax=Ricinus communis TaxID=3988 RepID=UPI00201B2FF2|nr:glucosamine 6-phosphate N-acetyltransferase-like [Ricinus communis]